jgi:hypothetical protein
MTFKMHAQFTNPWMYDDPFNKKLDIMQFLFEIKTSYVCQIKILKNIFNIVAHLQIEK